MPDHDAAMMRRLVKDLVVPEAHLTAEQLRSRNSERGIPQQVVEAGRDAPCTQRMKENLFGIGRFV